MYDLAKAIQRDRRRQACLQRIALSVPRRPRTVSVGRYRITVAHDSAMLDPAA